MRWLPAGSNRNEAWDQPHLPRVLGGCKRNHTVSVEVSVLAINEEMLRYADWIGESLNADNIGKRKVQPLCVHFSCVHMAPTIVFGFSFCRNKNETLWT